MFNAFDVIAGCSLGTWTQIMVLEELIDTLNFNTNGQQDGTKPCAGSRECAKDLIHDLDHIQPDNEDYDVLVDEMVIEAIGHLNYYAEIPESTTIGWRDNEVTVIPFIDEDNPRVADWPEDYLEDIVYLINDHGNVDCLEWRNGEYRSIWDMV